MLGGIWRSVMGWGLVIIMLHYASECRWVETLLLIGNGTGSEAMQPIAALMMSGMLTATVTAIVCLTRVVYTLRWPKNVDRY